MITKLCINCFRKYFPDASVGTLTWARECKECHTPTEHLGLLIKCEITAAMAESA